ncbi:MAG: LEA type 2 family protein [Treponema sp.]|nr:LEA type 2 family protein [Treponema sp.]
MVAIPKAGTGSLGRSISALLILLAAFLLFSCKTPPPAVKPGVPYASLKFDSVEARDTSAVNLGFVLDVGNPRPAVTGFTVDEWTAVINGAAIPVKLQFPDARLEGRYAFAVEPGTDDNPGIASIPFGITLDIPALVSAGIELKDDFTVDLTVYLGYGGGSQAEEKIQAAVTAVFPFVREPVFSITAIAVLKAELINTRFRVTMKIENPNYFPVDLSAFSYELYGNGLLWADGTERNLLTIPARSSVNANLFLLMNFINMKRDLLDQIIRLEDVNYRFAGDVMVGTGIDYLPRFNTEFDLSGYSQVLDN